MYTLSMMITESATIEMGPVSSLKDIPPKSKDKTLVCQVLFLPFTQDCLFHQVKQEKPN